MAGLGGKRPGAGRPKGSRNRRTELQAAAAEAGGITPLEYMLGVMRDSERDPEVRLDAAKSAAPYVHPKLVSQDTKLSGGVSITFQVAPWEGK